MGTIRRYADGFRVQIYSLRDPETGKQSRPSNTSRHQTPVQAARRPKLRLPSSSLITSTNRSHPRPNWAPMNELLSAEFCIDA